MTPKYLSYTNQRTSRDGIVKDYRLELTMVRDHVAFFGADRQKISNASFVETIKQALKSGTVQNASYNCKEFYIISIEKSTSIGQQ